MTILIMWVNRHRIFRHIRRIDDTFLVLNGLLLMAVTIVPFPTAVVSSWILINGAVTAAALYSGVFIAIAVLFNVMWRYAVKRGRLLGKHYNEVEVAAISRRYLLGPLWYVIAFALAFVNVLASVGMCLALAAYFALPGRKTI
jgi:uncharacterized membrane protein